MIISFKIFSLLLSTIHAGDINNKNIYYNNIKIKIVK